MTGDRPHFESDFITIINDCQNKLHEKEEKNHTSGVYFLDTTIYFLSILIIKREKFVIKFRLLIFYITKK